MSDLLDDDERAVIAARHQQLWLEKLRELQAKEQAEMDVRRAELPRALREDARERWRWFANLIGRVARRVSR